jgi:hypothetical protein
MGNLYVERYRFSPKNSMESEDLFTQLKQLLETMPNIQVDYPSNRKIFDQGTLLNVAFDHYLDVALAAERGANFSNTSVFESGRVMDIVHKLFHVKKFGKIVMAPSQHVTWSKSFPSYWYDPMNYEGTTQRTAFKGVTSWDVITTWGENASIRAGLTSPTTQALLEAPTSFAVNYKDTGKGRAKQTTDQYDYYQLGNNAAFTTTPQVNAPPLMAGAQGNTDIGTAGYATGQNASVLLQG